MQVYAISTEGSVERSKKLQQDLGDAVVLLSDPTGAALDAYGVRAEDPLAPPGQDVLARPATFYVHDDAQVRLRWLTGSYRRRPDASTVLQQVRALRGPPAASDG